jgi:hypothetical protein
MHKAEILIATQSIHTIFTTPKGRLEAVYPALLSIISNVAPYQLGLARATSSKMMDLFTLLSSPSFLLASESNHTLVMKLLDAINSILDNHLKGRPSGFVERPFIPVVVEKTTTLSRR